MDFEKIQLEEQLKEVEKKIKFTSIVNAPAMLVIGLGLFSKFGKNPESLHPLLANESVVNIALVIAVPWAAICIIKSVKLVLESNKLIKQLSK